MAVRHGDHWFKRLAALKHPGCAEVEEATYHLTQVNIALSEYGNGIGTPVRAGILQTQTLASTQSS